MRRAYDVHMSTAIALVRATHPGPTLSVTLVALVIGVAVDLTPLRLVILGFVILTNQASVGLSNDWLDAGRDRAVGRTDKPVALGLVSAQTVREWAMGCAVASVAASIVLSPWVTIANLVFLASAWGYNLGLKNTAISVAPYLLSFGLLPLIVTLSRADPLPATWWAMGMGALLGAAAHFTNVLPDLEDDRRTGIRGLPHRLGRTASGVMIGVALVAASALAVIGLDEPVRWIGWAGLAVNAAIAVICGVLLTRQAATRMLFRLIILAALVNVTLLAVSGDSLLA
jgi:4-hydroxybenzoate polyprenyltransferase